MGNGMKMDQKLVSRIGWIATIFAILLWLSFIDQIRLNLSGHPGSLLVGIVSVLNCSFWATYGFFLEKRSWPIVASNLPGVFLGLINVITVLIH